MKENMDAGGRCHLWKKCHYDTISLICIDKRLKSIGQKGTLQYWWKSYKRGYIKKDLQLLSRILKMARVGSESTEILLYVKRVSVLQVQRLIKEMEEMENRRGCVMEELGDDGNVVGEAVSEEPMMMGNMVLSEDEEDEEDADFFGGAGIGYYFSSDVDMPEHEGNEGEEEPVNEGKEEQVNEGEDMIDFGTDNANGNENIRVDEEEADGTDNANVGEDDEIHDGPQGDDHTMNFQLDDNSSEYEDSDALKTDSESEADVQTGKSGKRRSLFCLYWDDSCCFRFLDMILNLLFLYLNSFLSFFPKAFLFLFNSLSLVIFFFFMSFVL
ncbi:hypothetical protein M5689_005958 [Euphorbia peplus]|nr:hypothetical protein M5689_005958 [Euphorbia peplus]